MMAHALLSPSSAARWMRCPGSVALISAEKPAERTSAYAEEGTFAHAVAASLLMNEPLPQQDGFSTADVAEAVRPYVEYVQAQPGILQVEQRLPITWITGEANAFGTADSVLVGNDRLTIVDLKYGMGVQVDAPQNPQLAIYAAAALEAYAACGTFESVRMAIVQPRLDHVSEWTLPIEEFRDFVRTIKARAAVARAEIGAPSEALDFRPGEKTCKFCPMAGRCSAFAAFAQKAAGAEATPAADALMSPAELAGAMANVDAVELWCSKVRAEALDALNSGRPVPGFKVVSGREGPRKWSDEAAADRMLAGMRISAGDRYEKKLISPAKAQKLVKNSSLSEKQWARLERLITRSEGKPTVVPESDPRPSIFLVRGSDFKPLTSQE
jgi:hypothetical protein